MGKEEIDNFCAPLGIFGFFSEMFIVVLYVSYDFCPKLFILQPEFLSDRNKIITFVEDNDQCKYANFQLHPPYSFCEGEF